MLFDIDKIVHVRFNLEIKADVIRYTCLPNTVLFVIFFGPQRRMAYILKQKTNLLFERIFYFLRKLPETTIEMIRRFVSHYFSRCVINSVTVVKGPETRPVAISRNPTCTPAESFFVFCTDVGTPRPMCDLRVCTSRSSATILRIITALLMLIL